MALKLYSITIGTVTKENFGKLMTFTRMYSVCNVTA